MRHAEPSDRPTLGCLCGHSGQAEKDKDVYVQASLFCRIFTPGFTYGLGICKPTNQAGFVDPPHTTEFQLQIVRLKLLRQPAFSSFYAMKEGN